MLKVIKVKVEPLTAEAFEPFLQAIETFDEAKPEVRVGALTENEYTVTADVSDPPPDKLSLGRSAARPLCLLRRRVVLLSSPPVQTLRAERSWLTLSARHP